MVTSLQDDLLSIPGVEGADVEGSSSSPEGLRIRISEGADQEAVGGAIRKVLSLHGLGTDTQLPGEELARQRAEGETARELGSADMLLAVDDDLDDGSRSGEEDLDESKNGVDSDDQGNTIIDLTDDGSEPPTGDADARNGTEENGTEENGAADEDVVGDYVRPTGSSSVEESVRNRDVVVPDSTPSFVQPRPPIVQTPVESEEQPDDWAIARIESVGVREGRSSIVVTVRSSDGMKATEVAASTEGGVELAVVKATAQLVHSDRPDPIVVDIEDRRIEGVDIVMIVLDVDGKLVTGSAVVAAGRPFALGRATWAALAL